MLNFKGLFSEGYNEYLRRRDRIRGVVIKAQEEVKGLKIFDQTVDPNNPEDLIAALYLLYQDFQLYHERR